MFIGDGKALRMRFDEKTFALTNLLSRFFLPMTRNLPVARKFAAAIALLFSFICPVSAQQVENGLLHVGGGKAVSEQGGDLPAVNDGDISSGWGPTGGRPNGKVSILFADSARVTKIRFAPSDSGHSSLSDYSVGLLLSDRVKGGVKPDHWSGVKVDQRIG
jgi:hypothetical protein